MKFSVWPSYDRTWDETLALASWAEAAGFDGFWYADHLMPNRPDGTPDPGDALECWTVLSAIGALILGTALAAMRLSPVPTLNRIGTFYVNTIRNTPLTLIILFCSFGLAQALAGGHRLRQLADYAIARHDPALAGEPDEAKLPNAAQVTTRDIDLGTPGPDDWWADRDLATIRVRGAAANGKQIFIGVGRDVDVARYLAGVPHDEITDVDLRVTGSIPPSLSGRYLRTGSNPPSGTSSHWFAGDGMVHGVRLDAIRAGEVKLVYLAPERLMSGDFLSIVRSWNVTAIAIDEAHCISEWGHDFRPEYRRLKEVRQTIPHIPVLALTATATPSVAADIRTAFGIEPADHVQTSFLRANLHFRITPCTAQQRLPVLTKLLLKRKVPSIVYVTLQNTAEHVATHLQKNGVNALAYHAGLPDEHRHAAQDAFMNGQTDVIVATIAFGMGIDKADIRAVYHYNLPKTLENYSQETGRAGRDGKVSVCELLACADDCIVLENFTFGDTPTPQALERWSEVEPALRALPEGTAPLDAALLAENLCDAAALSRWLEGVGAALPRLPRIAFVKTSIWSRAAFDAREALAGLVARLGGTVIEVEMPG